MKNIKNLSPFVYWAQNECEIYLKIDLLDVQDPLVNLECNCLSFSCEGTGAHGRNEYSFNINFYNQLDIDKSKYIILDKYVTFVLVKSKSEWWPRVTSQPQKPHWLKIDFDRWQSPEELSDTELVGDILKDHPDIFEQLQKDEIGYKKEDMKKVYLTFYNFFLYLGFLYISVVLLMKFLKGGADFFPTAFETVWFAMYITTGIQFLELVHVLLGVTKGNALMTFFQVFGKMFILYLMIGCEPRIQNQPIVFFLFLTWCASEIVRYPYNITQIYKKNNKMLMWLQYNAWMILYPAGFCCEVIICYQNLVFLDETDKWSIHMPNSPNFIFNAALALRIYILFIAFPVLVSLLSHMYRLRTQKLRGGKRKKQ